MTDNSGPLDSGRRPPTRSRGARLTGRVLAVIGVLAVGGFGYLLGVRLNTSSGAGGQAGFSGQGGRQGSFQGQRSGSTRQGTQGASAAGNSATAGAGGSGARSGSRSSEAATTVTATVAKTGRLTAQRDTAGTVVPLTQSNVAAQAAGTVTQILTPVGTVVQKGQALTTLSSDTLQAAVLSAQNSLAQARVSLATQTNANIDQRNQLSLQVSSAQAALASAQQTYQANLNLYRIGGIAQTDLNSSKSAVDTARANLASVQNSLSANGRAKNETLAGLQLSVSQAKNSLAQAQQNLANTTVRAPFDGQVSAVSVSQGENVGAGGAVLTLVSQRRQVTFNVAPTDASALKTGQVLPFMVGQQAYQVKLDQNPAAPVNSVVTVSARLLGETRPTTGTVGTVSYSVPVASGTVVPSSALEADGTQAYVFVIDNGQAKRQNVTVLGSSGDQSALSGLNAGANVIATPPTGLLDGARVTTDDGSAASGTSSSGVSGQGQRSRRWQGAGTNGSSTGGGYRLQRGTNGTSSVGGGSSNQSGTPGGSAP